ncbi:exopolysaccharide biosynthesis GT4 family glycosyltransferase EpsE [Algicella marina]|uniref:Glycosyltransferase n=1 Tax=Algicella marina TaxID=2683284 RepID=A0A6P1T0P0_9RHOB|nr:exopolysaccharide biosynthesis GT4 family glycosyltransferase EpsE [Algicella marina]QHQ34082.1 glycosyltransferase [Algicella marina]
MPKIGKIAYLIPQFPGQTHMFFWREIGEVEARGTGVEVFSTRMPPAGLISHAWSQAAIARTTYLFNLRPLSAAQALAAIPWKHLRADIRQEGKGLLKEILLCAPAARELARQAKARGARHVHVHSCGRSALIAALAKLMHGLSYSLTLHGPMSDYGIGQPLKWRHAAFATIITEKLLAEVQTDLAGNLPPVLRVQAMGVDVETLKRSEPYTPPQPREPVRIFACGRLNVVKGHQDLCDAIAMLTARGIDATLEIAGEDDAGGSGFRKVLEEKIAAEGLADRVTMLGAIDADAVRQKLLEAHIFVLASWHEPLGVAYMEAMSCEVPTVGTAAGGVRELITDGVDGYLVEPRSPQALADTLERIIGNPEEAETVAKQGRQRIVKAFRSSLGAETILNEVESLVI